MERSWASERGLVWGPHGLRPPTEAELRARDPERIGILRAIHAMTLLGVEPWNEPLRLHSLVGLNSLFEATFGRGLRRADHQE